MPGIDVESVKLDGADSESQGSVKGEEGLNKETIRVSAFSQGCGLTVRGSINSKPLDFLVDTGSAITVVSNAMFDELNIDTKLKPPSHNILLADGSPLGVRGQTVLNVGLGDSVVEHEVVVANIEKDAILGMDFLTVQRCTLNLDKSLLRIGNTVLHMWNEYSVEARCCRIKVSKKVVVPGLSQMNIPGVAQKTGGETRYNAVEGTKGFVEKHGLFVGRTLSDISGGKVQVRVCNPREEPIEIWPGTTIAIAHPAEITRNACESNVSLNHVSQTPLSERVLPEKLQTMVENSSEFLNDEQKQKLWETVYEFQDVFESKDGELGQTSEVQHKINTGDARPIKQAPRRIPIHLRDEVDKAMKEMIDKGVIEPSDSPWSSPVVLVRKKDGSLRFCIDYRKLNEVTVPDAYPLPKMDEALDCLGGAKWFSTLDLASGYWQVEMDPEDKPKTAFATPSHGLYQWLVMPFGLMNAPGTFERLIERIMKGLRFEILLVYLDDVIIFGSTFEESLDRLILVLQRLRDAKLKLKAKKCHLFQKEVIYLGHKVSGNGIEADPGKIESVTKWPTPSNVTDVRSFLGLCSYYRKFIEGFSEIAGPLNKLTQKKQPFIWNDECTEAFEKLKQRLTSAPILAYPDPSLDFILDTDACNISIGAVLSQVQDGKERVIAYGSKSLNKHERNYCVTRKEMYAVVYFVNHFKHYLYAKKFLLRTDHGSLRYMFNFKDPAGQVARWLEQLNSYQFEIQHRPGRLHGNADGLSRIPCRQCGREEEPRVRAMTRRQLAKQNSKRTVETNDQVQHHIIEPTQSQTWMQTWTLPDIREKQLIDPNLEWIIRLLEKEQPKPSWKEVAHRPVKSKTIWFRWDQLQLRNEVLYMAWIDNITGEKSWRLVVPKELVVFVLEELHDQPTAGHLGENRSMAKVRARFFWAGMGEDIANHIRTCDACARAKEPRKKNKAALGHVPVGARMERVAMDLVGPWPRTTRGNKYILVIGDYFTKWMEAYCIPNIEAITVAEVFVEKFVSRMGTPKMLHSDRGTQFVSTLMQEVCRLLGIKKTNTAAFNPKSDGMVERFNSTMEAMIRPYVSGCQRDWDEFVPLLTMAYRSTPHASTNVSPYKMMFGTEMQLPIDLLIGSPEDPQPAKNTTEYVCELQDRLEMCHQHAAAKLGRAAEVQKKYYDVNLRGSPYKEGQKVWLRNYLRRPGLSPKLQNKYVGPFTIVQCISDAIYKIKKTTDSQAKIVHFNLLKPYLS